MPTLERKLKQLSMALKAMIIKLEFGERFTIDRYGRSVTFDAAAKALPFRVRSQVESPADRRGFAERVLPSTGPCQALADGIEWLLPGDRLHVTRGEIVEVTLEVIHPKQPDASASTSIPFLDVSETGLYVSLGMLRERVRGPVIGYVVSE